MPVITTTTATINPAPPSAELQALLNPVAPQALDPLSDDSDLDDVPGAPTVKGHTVSAKAPVAVSPEVAAARAALKAAEAAAKAAKTQETAEAKAAREQLLADAKAKKEQDKAQKALERAAEREQKKAEALAAIPVLAPVEIKPMAAADAKALEGAKVSEALRTAYSSENNSELAYKKLGERFGWSVTPLIEALVIENVWPLESEGKPFSYKKLYNAEKENGIKSWGHMVNRASERFTMLNPANIEKRKAAQDEARAKHKEEALQAAQGISKKAVTRTPGTKGVEGFDVAALTDIDLFDLAKACILAMPDNMRDLLALDPEVKEALNIIE